VVECRGSRLQPRFDGSKAAEVREDESYWGNPIYSAIASLDGYIEDAEGRSDWAAPSEEVHAFVNELERPIATYLYGRRMYETMVFP
jgi:hypothetical protein